jgi:D-alanyl-lipoteichoic acid acyltransferase DltB (MBOAT superfamily)
VFLIIAACVVARAPHKYRIPLLLISSYYFYSFWSVEFAALIFIISLIGYVSGLVIYFYDRNSRICFFISIATIVAMLVYFKYTNFLIESLNYLAQLVTTQHIFHTTYSIVLPVGISFYTFQVVGYLIDVYLKRESPERRFDRFLLFVSFFPQLLAGPIERSSRLLPQLSKIRGPSLDEFSLAVTLITWGLFKKVVLAEHLATVVNHSFSTNAQGGFVTTMLALYGFSFQILCDFSAYTDIALGSALLFGIRLVKNFNDPFGATSINDYWSRWHISLTTWFTDYIYYPLCFNQRYRLPPSIAIIVVFSISGLWHGASWTFVAWGLYHGVLITVENHLQGWNRFSRLTNYPWIRRIFVFNLVALSWLLFRSSDFSETFSIINRLFDFQLYEHDFYFLFILIVCSIPLSLSFIVRTRLLNLPGIYNYIMQLRIMFLLVTIPLILIFAIDESRQFYYFQF